MKQSSCNKYGRILVLCVDRLLNLKGDVKINNAQLKSLKGIFNWIIALPKGALYQHEKSLKPENRCNDSFTETF